MTPKTKKIKESKNGSKEILPKKKKIEHFQQAQVPSSKFPAPQAPASQEQEEPKEELPAGYDVPLDSVAEFEIFWSKIGSSLFWEHRGSRSTGFRGSE